RDQRPVQRNVVIGIADWCRDRDDFAVAALLRSGDGRRDLLPVGVGELRHHEPDAPPPPKEPPPPEKPPKPPPPPPPQPPPPPPHDEPPSQLLRREPRLSSLRPQSTTQGLMPPWRLR